MTALATMKCTPCAGGVAPLPREKVDELLGELAGWSVENGHHLAKEYKFPSFIKALAFVNQIGAVAEQEGHHPDIYLSWGRVGVKIWTHQIDSLTENDFVLAAKIDALLR